MPLLDDWERIGQTPSGSGIYRNPDGDTVSRRQYENAKADQGGWSSWSAQRTFKEWTSNDPQYQRFAEAAAKAEGTSVQAVTKNPNSAFNQYYRESFAKDSGAKKDWKSVDKSKDGAFRDLMEYVDFYDADDDWGYEG